MGFQSILLINFGPMYIHEIQILTNFTKEITEFRSFKKIASMNRI